MVLSFSYFVVLLSTFLLSKASVASLVEVLFVFVGQILCSERRSFPLDWQSINFRVSVSGKREASGLPRQVRTFILWRHFDRNQYWWTAKESSLGSNVHGDLQEINLP